MNDLLIGERLKAFSIKYLHGGEYGKSYRKCFQKVHPVKIVHRLGMDATLPVLDAFYPSIARLFMGVKVHKKFTLWLQPSRFPLIARGIDYSTYRYTINREANNMKNKAKMACKIRRFLVHFGPLEVLSMALSGLLL